MALDVSSPASDMSPRHQELSDRLDADIARIRAEIQSLTKRKQLLTSSLLSTTQVQNHFQKPPQANVPIDVPMLDLHCQAEHNRTNIHRLAYGVTSFPFTDPNPDTSDKPLLGIRFDIPSRNGKFEKAPYYIFLKRVDENTQTASTNNTLKIHHHTIPALVPLQDYEAKYLPPQPTTSESQNERRGDEGYFSPSPTTSHADNNSDTNNTTPNHTHLPSQDVHGLATSVRNDLMSWRLRSDTINLLAEDLKVNRGRTESHNDKSSEAKFSLESVQATAVDARFCRIVWQNGTVGRLRLTDDGHVDRAIVIGAVGEDGGPGRMKDIERFLTTNEDGGRLSVTALKERLKDVEARVNDKRRESRNVSEDNSDMEIDHADT